MNAIGAHLRDSSNVRLIRLNVRTRCVYSLAEKITDSTNFDAITLSRMKQPDE